MRRVLVTGGGSGIGRAVARAFADAGEDVTVAGRRMDALEETSQGRMTCRAADVADEAQVAALFDAPFDVVVANAGIGQPARLRDMELPDFERIMRVNVTGVFLTFREALRAGMPTGGRLIAMASTASLQGGPFISAYVASKHAVLGLVRSAAKEVASDGITCNAICPGYVDTPMADAAAAGLVKRHGITEGEAKGRLAHGNPMGRLIEPEEVASAALYLASPGASSVNGHALTVSGGEL